jgi:hypothetical protein
MVRETGKDPRNNSSLAPARAGAGLRLRAKARQVLAGAGFEGTRDFCPAWPERGMTCIR